MSNSLWITTVRVGKSADRPAKTEVPDGTFAFYYASDTGELALWDSSLETPAWVTMVNVASLTSTPFQLPVKEFADLPEASTSNAGAIAYVTNLNSTTIGATAAGGGTGKAIVVSDGSNWIVGGVPTQG